MLRLDEGTVLALARHAAAEEEDDRLGTDVQMLMNSPLPAEDIHAVWLAGVRRCFDPVEDGTNLRAWLRRLADACLTRPRERDPVEVRVLDKVRPVVLEGELREAVATEISFAAAGLEQAVAVPGIVAPLRRVVNEVDADLGFRMFLRAAKAYSLPINAGQYDRFLTIGDLLAYPAVAIHEGLNVRWPAIDPGRRDFACGRFGLPVLAAVFYGSGWRYEGTVHENIKRAAHADSGLVPGRRLQVCWKTCNGCCAQRCPTTRSPYCGGRHRDGGTVLTSSTPTAGPGSRRSARCADSG
jgi:hypothetical protein